ncbi:MAG: hypothetical protein HKN20_16900 [Gemmatimonadetes bacterium]|nr:hypothetical protein [Gemmatimonadota bacterium]
MNLRAFVPALVLLLVTGPAAAFDEMRAPFAVELAGEVVPFALFTLTALPNTSVEITFPGRDPKAHRVDLRTAGSARETLEAAGVGSGAARLSSYAGGYRFRTGGTPGLDVLTITNEFDDSVVVNVFTMLPLASVRNGIANGFRIGSYPADRYRGLDAYAPPPGFIEVTADNQNTFVSPHFQLGQFLCKQPDPFPKYLALRPELLEKLERILMEVNRRGIACESFVVMSGFRSPFYNKGINGKKYSRHMWGGAADIYIDVNPVDGQMDDLNGDGRFTRDDALWLDSVVEGLSGKPWFAHLVGGLGDYGTTPSHGPFVHVDVRGFRARW